ncbi:hypothetical protein [Paraburkholderia flava]|uniref:hypothetical protein n=1 Tax=Paraburkholderia flava TaxID=2547393 RepID=UPI00105BDFB5|nr:hypothetical protein [Paraburkholderia flava]
MSEEPDLQVCRATRRATSMTITGTVLILLSAALTIALNDALGFGTAGMAGVVLIVMGVWKSRNAYVTFRADHFETKLAPGASWHAVLYSEVTRAELNGKKLLTIDYRQHNVASTAKPKRIKIRLTEMIDDEREACVAAFRAHLPRGVMVEVR